MPKSGNKKRADMESPWFWFLLVIPATVAIMAYQSLERPMYNHTGTLSSQPTSRQFDAIPAASPAAFGNAPPVRLASTVREDGEKFRERQARSAPINTDDSAPLPSDGLRPADALQRPDAQTTTLQGSPISIAGGVNPGSQDRGGGPSTERSSTDASGPPVYADLVPILDENPYLPVADENYDEPMMADTTAAPECPQVLFRGGNAYARLRLTQMGCEIPGG